MKSKKRKVILVVAGIAVGSYLLGRSKGIKITEARFEELTKGYSEVAATTNALWDDITAYNKLK